MLALPAGALWLSLHIDTVLCIYNPVNETWNGEHRAQNVSSYAVPFKAEMEAAA